MLELQRGTSQNLYANFLTLESKEGAVITDPIITIRHVDSSGTPVVDINEQPMSLAIETLYFFKWTIPVDADLGVYSIEYEATIDGEYAEANEQFQIVEDIDDEVCDEPYTTKEKVGAFLGVDANKIDADWIAWTTQYIETFTCQRFCIITTTEKIDIESLNERTLMLDNYPILELLEIKNDGTVIDLNDIAVYEDEGFLKIKDAFIISSSTVLESGFFVRGVQKVEVTYRYGYKDIPKDIEWAATVLAASIGVTSLTQSGSISVGDVIEEEIGEYRRRKSTEESGSTAFSSLNIENSKTVNDRIEEDIFSAKNVLRMYRDRKMRAV